MLAEDAHVARVFICLLGPFRIIKLGRPVSVRSGGKAERLLICLAMHPQNGLTRDALIEQVWPEYPSDLAGQSLNTLTYWLKNQLSDALGGGAPILREQGRCALNMAGGLDVDVLEFESAVASGQRLDAAGSTSAAMQSYASAVSLYRGDLAANDEVRALLEREHLRTMYLATLGRIADLHFEQRDYPAALRDAEKILYTDPCREDAHRLAMRAYVRIGQRAQAMRQYRLCREILAVEFDAVPEPKTEQLFEIIRSDPANV